MGIERAGAAVPCCPRRLGYLFCKLVVHLRVVNELVDAAYNTLVSTDGNAIRDPKVVTLRPRESIRCSFRVLAKVPLGLRFAYDPASWRNALLLNELLEKRNITFGILESSRSLRCLLPCVPLRLLHLII